MAAKACKNHHIGRVKLKININFLDQNSISSTNDHLTDFNETPSPLSGPIPLSDRSQVDFSFQKLKIENENNFSGVVQKYAGLVVSTSSDIIRVMPILSFLLVYDREAAIQSLLFAGRAKLLKD